MKAKLLTLLLLGISLMVQSGCASYSAQRSPARAEYEPYIIETVIVSADAPIKNSLR